MSEETVGVMLLADIESILEKFHLGKIHSDDLVSHLGAMEDRPWAEWSKGKPDYQAPARHLVEGFRRRAQAGLGKRFEQVGLPPRGLPN
jgi:hypothetical protein